MIKACHLQFYVKFYELYAQIGIHRNFSNIFIEIPTTGRRKPLLVMGNHHSWWDGFWILHLNRLYWKKRFHVMMKYEQLRKHPTFRYAGAYSVDQGRRSIVDSLNYTENLLQKPNNLVLLFPQGKIQSQHINCIKFQKGATSIIRRSNNVDIMMIATFTDYFSRKKCGLWIYGQLLDARNNPEAAYNAFYQSAKKTQQAWTG